MVAVAHESNGMVNMPLSIIDRMWSSRSGATTVTAAGTRTRRASTRSANHIEMRCCASIGPRA